MHKVMWGKVTLGAAQTRQLFEKSWIKNFIKRLLSNRTTARFDGLLHGACGERCAVMRRASRPTAGWGRRCAYPARRTRYGRADTTQASPEM